LGADYVSRIRACVAALDEDRVSTTIVTGAIDEYGALLPPAEQSFLGHQDRVASPERLVNIALPAAVFPRECLDRMRFDERLVHAYDEVDFVGRAIKAGFSVRYCPAAINHHWRTPVGREYYRGNQEADRLYVTFKRYCMYEKRRLRAFAFAFVAPLHAIASGARRGGASGALAAFRAVAAATHNVFQSLRRGEAGFVR
jgi:hypothetical protein